MNSTDFDQIHNSEWGSSFIYPSFLKKYLKNKIMKEYKIKDWIFIAAILGGISVALGAFGSHLLEGILDAKDYDIFRTGVRYQMWHTLAIFITAVLQKNSNLHRFNQIQWSFLLGIIFFSGSLYILVLSQLRWFGAITHWWGCFRTRLGIIGNVCKEIR